MENTNVKSVKPIETIYNGYRFRSRLEARWAVFFDTLGVKYEYEPEGFRLPSGGLYLPDFKVKCYGKRGDCTNRSFDLWIEVKGKMTERDASKIKEFAGLIRRDAEGWTFWDIANPVLIVNKIPRANRSWDSYEMEAYDKMDGIDIYPFNYELIDGDYFGAYPAAKGGKFYLWGDDSNYIDNDDVEAVENAYRAARQARFEHGETPMAPKKANHVIKCPLHEYVATCQGCDHEHDEQCDFGVEIGWNGDFVVGLYPNYQ